MSAIQKGVDFHGSANTPEQEKEYVLQLLNVFSNGVFFLDYLSQWRNVDAPDNFDTILSQIKPCIVENLKKTQKEPYNYLKQ